MLRSPHGLATAVTVLLSAVIATDLFSVLAGLYQYVLAGRDAVTQGELDRGDAVYAAAGLLQILGLLATAVVFIIWFYRTRVNAEVFSQAACGLGRGWAIGAWFVPIGNLWLPRRIAGEIWAASTQSPADGSWRAVSYALPNAWWAAWVGSAVLDRVAAGLDRSAEGADAVQQAATVMIGADLLNVGAAVLAILFVRKLSDMQHLKATQGPVAAAGPTR